MRKTPAGFNDGQGLLAQDLLVRVGPTIRVDIGLKPRSYGDAGPDLELKGQLALIDTGASDNCIDTGAAVRAKLTVIDQRVVSGIGGVTKVNMYLGRIWVPALERLLFQAFAGVELASGDQAHAAILGRTFLKPYTLRYHGPTGEVEIEDSGPVTELAPKDTGGV